MEFCRFPPGSSLADIGCGDGGSARYLAEKYDARVAAVDCDPQNFRGEGVDGVEFHHARAENLPLADGSFDGVFFECSLSAIRDKLAALSEARRILRTGGFLSISDFFAEPGKNSSGGIPALDGDVALWNRYIERAGFEVAFTEDCSGAAQEFWGQMILDFGLSETARRLCGGEIKNLRVERRYFMIIARAKK
jgi:ubiquinone/menaquinone biosynthesis C-methylase UbiE